MIRRALSVVLVLAYLSTGHAQEVKSNQRASRRGESADCGSRNATVLSMMGWGVGLCVGIATLCALIPDNTGSSSSNNNSHSH